MADLLLDVLSARHRVPHAGTGEPLHVFHDNERFLLQGDDGQVVVIQLRIAEGVKARPHWVLEGKAAVVQFPHLEGRTTNELNRQKQQTTSLDRA